MANDLLLAIDGGQTSTEALLGRADGTILARGRGGPMDHVFAGAGEQARAALHGTILSTFAAAGLEPTVAVVVAGITGVGRGEPELKRMAGIIAEAVRAPQIVVVPDYVTNLTGASAGESGIVVIAGGGAVAYGQTKDGRDAIAGGYGYLLGDEGGGFDIGRRAIAASIRAHDKRGIATALEPVIIHAFGLRQLDDIKRVVYVPGFARNQLAALVPLVVETAHKGDSVAANILRTAGEELAQIGLAVAHILHHTDERIHIYPTGGVFQAGEILCRPFADTIQAGWPGAQVCAPHHSPVAGALLLAARLYGIDDADIWLIQIADLAGS